MNITTRWFLARIGWLNMYSGEPWGLWVIRRRGNSYFWEFRATLFCHLATGWHWNFGAKFHRLRKA